MIDPGDYLSASDMRQITDRQNGAEPDITEPFCWLMAQIERAAGAGADEIANVHINLVLRFGNLSVSIRNRLVSVLESAPLSFRVERTDYRIERISW